MKLLIALNVILALLYTVIVVAFRSYQSAGLLIVFTVLMLLLGGLALWNVAAVFTLWGQHRLRAFCPIITFALVVPLSFDGAGYATRLMRKGTPCSPDSFLKGQTRIDLETTAAQILGHSFKRVSANPHLQAEMITGFPKKVIPLNAANALHQYGFQAIDIDDTQSLVTFDYQCERAWYRYTYASENLVPLGSRPPTITIVDVEDWSELLRIAKQGDHATAEEATRIVFSPGIVYPYLRQNLGQDLLDRLKRYSSDQEMSAEQKQVVLNTLNRQWLPSSRLVEHSDITYDNTKNELHLGRIRMDAFWVVTLMKRLLADGILTYADDKSHLRIRENLSPSDQNRIAWLHVGLMNFLYGNLFKKTEHLDDKYLGDGWYLVVE